MLRIQIFADDGMVCTFTGWVEAYPTKTEKAKEVA